MPLPLLGIASGAFKIGQKLFSGIKARREKKKAKQAEKSQRIDDKLAKVEANLQNAGVNLGSSTISQAGASLQLFKDLKAADAGGDAAPVGARQVGDVQGEGGQRPPMPEWLKWGAIALGAFVVLKQLKIFK